MRRPVAARAAAGLAAAMMNEAPPGAGFAMSWSRSSASTSRPSPQPPRDIATAAASSRTSLIAREGSSRVACVAVCLAPNGQIVSQVHASRVMARVPGVHAIRRSPSLIPDPMSTRCRRRPIAMVLVSTAIAYPHPRHARRSALGRVRPAGWRAPELTGAFPADVDPARSGPRVCAGHRPATPEPDDRQNRAVFDTPTRYTREGLDHVSAGQRPSHARGGR